MALADTSRAIGQVSVHLRDQLILLLMPLGVDVTVGRPQPPAPGGNGGGGLRLNLFLYEAQFDATLRNHPLDTGQQPPLWLVLKYLLTAFDEDGESDTVEALDLVGAGLRVLQELNFQHPAFNQANPEPLKITFDEAPFDMLSKLMQGPDSRYRFSMAFQVRPVMVATGALPSYALLVGVDSTVAPPAIIGEDGIQIPVLPSLGPTIRAVAPAAAQVGGTFTVRGAELHLPGLAVRLGAAELPVVAQRTDLLRCSVDGALVAGGVISAGSHPLLVVQTLATGRRRLSNPLLAGLLPTLDSASASGVTAVAGGVTATIQLDGVLLGREHDDVFLALHRDGEVVEVFDAPFVFAPDQTVLTLQIPATKPVPAGEYRVILRVNRQQARRSPLVSLVP